jgi:hypothetical protein
MSDFPIAPNIQAILDKLEPEDREVMIEQLRLSHHNARRHAIASVMARNFSHGVGSAVCEQTT